MTEGNADRGRSLLPTAAPGVQGDETGKREARRGSEKGEKREGGAGGGRGEKTEREGKQWEDGGGERLRHKRKSNAVNSHTAAWLRSTKTAIIVISVQFSSVAQS